MSEAPQPTARPKDRAEALVEAHMAGHIQLKQRDQEFLEGIVEKDRDSLSPKQEAWLSDIEKRASE